MMYLHGFLNGVFAGPPSDLALRADLREQARALGVPALHEKLRLVDPVAAAKIHAHEGICQFLFLQGNEACETSYADKSGKYMGQRGTALPRM